MEKRKIISMIPNCITVMRIVGTICLWFTDTFSTIFFVLYTLTGVSDALDGIVARATKTTSELGTKLDSIADMLFYTTMIIKVFPVLWIELPLWLWCVAGAVVVMRICSYTLAAVKYRCFATLHTYMNKLTGFTLFIVPYATSMAGAVYACTVLLVVATVSTVEELLIHITRAEYRSNVKSIVVKG